MLRTNPAPATASRSGLSAQGPLAAGLILAVILPSFCWADPPETGAQATHAAEALFARDVLPVFRAKCFACHGSDTEAIRGGLKMITRDGLLAGGESGEPAILPGDSASSLLYQAICWDGYEMPPKKNDRLTERQIASVGSWIDAGAPWPEAERLAELEAAAEWDAGYGGIRVTTSGGLSDDWTQRRYEAEDLWAYQPIRRPEVPAGATHPVDAFIASRLAERQLQPAPEVDRPTLIRRLTFDLTGLPPTPGEIEDYLADTRPDAYGRLVDRLLASEHYGERMAQHWLDVVRYGDTNGFSNDFERPAAWRYRDYVVRSFNADKPYNEFVVEQIAGDELDPQDPENLIAVGFLRMGPWEHTDMSVAAETRQQWLDDVTNSVGVTFLATEMSCFKCHDHKFDPLPTQDYYRMQAVFAPTQFVYRRVGWLPEENTQGVDEGLARVHQLRKDPGIELLLPEDATEEERAENQLGVNKVLKKAEQHLRMSELKYQPLAFSVYNGPPNGESSQKPTVGIPPENRRKGSLEDIYILAGGALEAPTTLVTPGVLSVVSGIAGPSAATNVPEGVNGRRLALARWIVDPDNPVPARVMANRIWQTHFGRGLAGNPNNFGAMGAKPTHPELLDWLAEEFIASGWSVKHLHRLMVTSEAYRRSTVHPTPELVTERDPQGDSYAAFRPRRLSAEELRDSMLSATGELNLTLGGLPVRPEINLEVAMQPRHVMGSVAPAYQASPSPKERHRRTLYAERIRTLRDPMLEVFDKPGPDMSCERRDSSTVTPQVFSLFNSQNSYDRSLALANRVMAEARTPEEQIDLAFRLVLNRAATPGEIELCREHWQAMTRRHAGVDPEPWHLPEFVEREMVEEMTGVPFQWRETLDIYASGDFEPDLKPWDVNARTRGLAEVCLVLFNSNEFAYVY